MKQVRDVETKNNGVYCGTDNTILFINVSNKRTTAISTNENTNEWISSDSVVDTEEMR